MRVKNIFIQPAKELRAMIDEPTTPKELFKNYILILAILPALFGMLGFMIFGISYGFGTAKMPSSTLFSWFLVTYFFSLVNVYLLAFVINRLGKYFGAEENFTEAIKIVAFSYTPIWVVGILSIIPLLSPLKLIAAIYTFVLFYLSLKTKKNIPQERVIGYYIIIIAASLVLFLVFGSIAGSIASAGVKFGAL